MNAEVTQPSIPDILGGARGKGDDVPHTHNKTIQERSDAPENSIHGALRILLHLGTDLLIRSWLLEAGGEVYDGDIGSRHSERHASQLALELRQHCTHGLGSSGGRRDDVACHSSAAAPVLSGRAIYSLLRCSGGVHSSHEAFQDPKLVVEDLHSHTNSTMPVMICVVTMFDDDRRRDDVACDRAAATPVLGGGTIGGLQCGGVPVKTFSRIPNSPWSTCNDLKMRHFFPIRVIPVSICMLSNMWGIQANCFGGLLRKG
jgi:hypothetical protein